MAASIGTLRSHSRHSFLEPSGAACGGSACPTHSRLQPVCDARHGTVAQARTAPPCMAWHCLARAVVQPLVPRYTPVRGRPACRWTGGSAMAAHGPAHPHGSYLAWPVQLAELSGKATMQGRLCTRTGNPSGSSALMWHRLQHASIPKTRQVSEYYKLGTCLDARCQHELHAPALQRLCHLCSTSVTSISTENCMTTMFRFSTDMHPV